LPSRNFSERWVFAAVKNPAPTFTVRHNIEASRFEAEIDGQHAVADYELVGNEMIFTHTFVPPALRGRGIAEKLVEAALNHAREKGHQVLPRCSYVAVYIERRPEFKKLLASA
jgi:predicted GNAT family acetyltransferase